ncbi:MAG: translocation/assembly module TamB, partial [Sphingomicrobium sp.]
MAETLIVEKGSEPQRIVVRRDWPRRLLNELLALFIALLVILAAALILLDTAPGHRFIVDRIAGIETSSGLKIRIGRIDGSVFGKSELRNVAISDQQGVFLTAPSLVLDWSPAAWLTNSLSIDSLTAARVTLVRAPHLKPSTKKGPILPNFDIHIGELRIDRLDIGSAVAGTPRSGRVQGSAEIHSGRALVELYAFINNGGDRVHFKLDAEPDRDRFDIDARVRSPGDGVLPAIVGT